MWSLMFNAGGGPRKKALLVLCNLYDGVVGPHLGETVTSLQDARQIVGQGPWHRSSGLPDTRA